LKLIASLIFALPFLLLLLLLLLLLSASRGFFG
jgi:hypothetical protein